MNNWTVVSYIFLGFGSVLLVLAAFIFSNIYLPYSANPLLAPVAGSVALSASAPWIVLTACAYVVGGVGYYAGQDYVEESSDSEEASERASPLLDRIDRLEGIVDNNFIVITKRLDKIEETQKMSSQNTIVKAKKE